jgi:hypothetical protein
MHASVSVVPPSVASDYAYFAQHGKLTTSEEDRVTLVSDYRAEPVGD